MRNEDETRQSKAKSARYGLVIRATIAGLENPCDDTRGQVYERARNAMRDAFAARQLRPLAAEVDRERAALEEAIRRIESEARDRSALREETTPGGKAISGNRVSPRADEGPPAATLNTPREERSDEAINASAAIARATELLRAVRDSTDSSDKTQNARSNPLFAGATHAAEGEDLEGLAQVEQTADTREAVISATPVGPRLAAMIEAARSQGVELDPNEYRPEPDESAPSATALSLWAQNGGMWARAVRVGWRHLFRVKGAGPVVLLFNDGGAALLTDSDPERMAVFLKNPEAPNTPAVAVDELRLAQVWSGDAIMLRASRGRVAADAPFDLRWVVELVLQERRSLRDIAIASVTMSLLTVFPPLLVMAMVSKVLQFQSVSTLALLATIAAITVLYETVLGYARRLIIAVVGARLDAKLNLHVFNRLLRLPLDYFERHPAGETMYRLAQVYRVREFLTGRLLSTFLDLITLCVLLPVLFFLNAKLASVVLACAGLILLIIFAFLKPLRDMYGRVASAETWKSATLGETIVGIKTVKSLALEPQRKGIWDERIAEAGKWRLEFARLANWPQTLVNPIERFMVLGTMILGAYMAMNDPSGYLVGGLFAFLMLSQRVAQPLVGLAETRRRL